MFELTVQIFKDDAALDDDDRYYWSIIQLAGGFEDVLAYGTAPTHEEAWSMVLDELKGLH